MTLRIEPLARSPGSADPRSGEAVLQVALAPQQRFNCCCGCITWAPPAVYSDTL